ncbi:hypothetical protein [Nakamurella sp. PAMC28650]|uniref:hypothetical protein n=1 Tax=Nakamurella sp. PAMC28650 TaxID=2762325 RepID=UPI002106ABCD|nr:hypothetical protein [Nakamurella sp. PAMC28650]
MVDGPARKHAVDRQVLRGEAVEPDAQRLELGRVDHVRQHRSHLPSRSSARGVALPQANGTDVLIMVENLRPLWEDLPDGVRRAVA